MSITTLKASPEHYSATLQLIEKAFQYKTPHSFAVDFAPLLDKSNWEHCFIKILEGKVVAHIGVCERKILGCCFAMLGGIAVDEAHRGEGIFQELLQDVLAEKRSDVAAFMLWSDQEKLYKKYGFHLCGTQFEISPEGKPFGFEATKLSLMNENEMKEIHTLYEKGFSKWYVTTERKLSDWEQLKRISSADLYIHRKDSKIDSYFFANKGQDLTGIIYEYSSAGVLQDLVSLIRPYGKIWTSYPPVEDAEAQYQFFLLPADQRLFGDFIHKYTQGQMKIEGINPMKQEIYFHFNDELLGLETEEFLRGTLGPGIFEELGEKIKPLFISGLVSV